MASTPRYLLKITEWPRPAYPGDPAADVPYVIWLPCSSEQEADRHIEFADRPGFGKHTTRAVLEKFLISAIPRGTIDIPPITMLERALTLKQVNGTSVVDVTLRGRYQDGPSVFWCEDQAFAIINTRGWPALEAVTSDQGVGLVAISYFGDIRWTVTGDTCGHPQNQLAVEHFGLTWGDDNG